MADVFISYARSTEECARALAGVLEADGHSVWYDARLPAHRTYGDVIQEQIDAAKAVLIIWSKEAVRSQWVRSEADRGRHNGTLVQLRIEECALPMPFDQIQCPALEGWSGDRSDPAFHVVRNTLSELLDGGEVTVEGPGGGPGVRTARSEEAQLLLEAAMKGLQSGRADEHAQAIPLLIEATRIAPEDGEVWGLLSVLYAAVRRSVPAAQRAGLEARARSAIKTTFALRPNDARARCAEVILMPAYRNWEGREAAALDVLREFPGAPLAQFSLANVQAQTGRWREAAATACRISRTRFLLPAVEQFTVLALWSAGDIVQAELAGERAARRFPAFAGLWEARVTVLAHSGRTGEAIAMLDDSLGRPRDYPLAKLDAARLTALALAGSASPDEAIRHNLQLLETGGLDALTVAQRCAALGRDDDCFGLLDGHYLAKGNWASCRQVAEEDLSTSELFMPPMNRLRNDRRFAKLIRDVGLEAYWKRIGKEPDFRSTAVETPVIPPYIS